MKDFYPEKEINEIANEIVTLMPSLAPFFANTETLPDYSRRINIYQPNPIYLRRQSFFKRKLVEKIHSLFTEAERKNIKIQIAEDQGVAGGIIEHHGILDPPGFLSIPLVANFYKLFAEKEKSDIVSFASGNVSLNEYFRRRGILFHGRKINLYPKADKNKVIYGLHTYDFDIVKILKRNHQWHTYTPEEQKFLEEITHTIKQIDFSTCKYLGDQLTKINFYLWPLLFEEKIRQDVPNLISVEYDGIVIDYLIYVLENEKESFIYQMLFDDVFRRKVLDEFEGVVGAWDEKKDVGTHFFWALDENNERIHLRLRKGYLIAKNSDCRIPFTEDALVSALLSKKLLPGMFLKFALTLFYMGMKPFTGQASFEYLTTMRKRIINILQDDFPHDAELAAELLLDGMVFVSICKGKNEEGNFGDLHAFDIFYAGGFTKEYFEKVSTIPFKYFLIPGLLMLYGYAVSKYSDLKNIRSFSVTDAELQGFLEKYFKDCPLVRVS